MKELKDQGGAKAQALANITDQKTRLAAAVYAYWNAPEINASALSFKATGKASPVHALEADRIGFGRRAVRTLRPR